MIFPIFLYESFLSFFPGNHFFWLRILVVDILFGHRVQITKFNECNRRGIAESPTMRHEPQALYEPSLVLDNVEFMFHLILRQIQHFQNLRKPYTNLHSFWKMLNLCST